MNPRSLLWIACGLVLCERSIQNDEFLTLFMKNASDVSIWFLNMLNLHRNSVSWNNIGWDRTIVLTQRKTILKERNLEFNTVRYQIEVSSFEKELPLVSRAKFSKERFLNLERDPTVLQHVISWILPISRNFCMLKFCDKTNAICVRSWRQKIQWHSLWKLHES